ncbi:MAG: hypothetical protein H7098_10085 [Oligoflexus sp.]|nr:hypothetical protein [Pseudopedobacter sp.]
MSDDNVKTSKLIDKNFLVSSVLQSNMVIQRDKPIKIMGNATANTLVKVTTSWSSNAFITKTLLSGFWEIEIPSASVNLTPQSIIISKPEEETPNIELDNILIGDVWICSGQSNMVMPVGPLAPSFSGVENFSDEITNANYPKIRSLTIKEDYQQNPLIDFNLTSKWITCSPSSVPSLSATAYFFARKLNVELNVPIGIIVSGVNGSWCETWTNNEAFSQNFLNNYVGSNQSSMLYNGMIAPLTKLSVKGFIWYQGENNQRMYPVNDYTKLNSALIKGWRSKFAQLDLPFYYVQITPFDDGVTNDPSLNYLAKFREAQQNIRNEVNKTGMVVTMDVGDKENHHPKYKKQVGERLAYLALDKTYSKSVTSEGPRFSSFTQNGNTVTINFINNTANGLKTIGNQPIKQFFFMAGSDKIFMNATATISGDKIILSVPTGISLPIAAVRYAFTNYPITNLENASALPMEPFRSDNWDN